MCVVHGSNPVIFTLPLTGICTCDGRTSDADCLNALTNSSVIMGYGELLRWVCLSGSLQWRRLDRVRDVSSYCNLKTQIEISTIQLTPDMLKITSLTRKCRNFLSIRFYRPLSKFVFILGLAYCRCLPVRSRCVDFQIFFTPVLSSVRFSITARRTYARVPQVAAEVLLPSSLVLR